MILYIVFFCDKSVFLNVECQQYIPGRNASVTALSRDKWHFGWSVVL